MMYHIVTIDEDGRVLIGEGMIDYEMLVEMVLVAISEYEKLNKEVFICEVWA
jgi:hypothetical protein